MNRHRLLKTVTVSMVAVTAVSLAGCAQTSTASPDKGATKALSVFISGGANIQELWEKSLIPAFEKENKGYGKQEDIDFP